MPETIANSLFIVESRTAAQWLARLLCRGQRIWAADIEGPVDSDSVELTQELLEECDVFGITPDKETAFRVHLAKLIQQRLIADGNLQIVTEPQPDNLLLEAAEMASLRVYRDTTFPPHTSIWITPGKVEAKLGFTGAVQNLRLWQPPKAQTEPQNIVE